MILEFDVYECVRRTRIPDAARGRLNEASSGQVFRRTNEGRVFPVRKDRCLDRGKAPRDYPLDVGTAYGHRLAGGAMNLTTLVKTVRAVRMLLPVFGRSGMMRLMAIRLLDRFRVITGRRGFAVEARGVRPRKHARLKARHEQERKREHRAKRSHASSQDLSKDSHCASWARVREKCQEPQPPTCAAAIKSDRATGGIGTPSGQLNAWNVGFLPDK